jgi:uncharacterized repeat protein (TIGR03803 family)
MRDIALLCAAGLAILAPGPVLAQTANTIEVVAPYPEHILPHGDLVIGSDGQFYGTGVYGGTNGTGIIYRVSQSGELATLHSFAAADDNGINVGGAYPQAGVVFGPDGNLYGTTVYGGLEGEGTVYKLTLDGAQPVLTTLHEFPALDQDYKNTGGARPYSALVLAGDGNFYGNTVNGGTGGRGTIFRISPSGGFTTLHEFSATVVGSSNSDGANPVFRMTVGPDGNLYGAARFGGEGGVGTLYRVTLAGEFTTLHSFAEDLETGAFPTTVTFGADGALYGTTSGGGNPYGVLNAHGTLFRFTPTGGLNSLYTFSAHRDGASAYRAALVQDANGAFYGITEISDGSGGVIYRFTPGRSMETLYTFGSREGDLEIPGTTVIKGLDGKYYGTASVGSPGVNENGGVFRFSPSMPAAVSLSVYPTRISLGQAATLTWSASSYLYCSGSRAPSEGWDGKPRPNTGSELVSPKTTGTYLFQMACHNNSYNLPSGATTVWLYVVEPHEDSGAPSPGALLLLVLAAWRRRFRH